MKLNSPRSQCVPHPISLQGSAHFACFLNASSSAKLASGQPCLRKSWSRSSLAEARLLTSTHRQTDRKALSSLLSFSGFLRRGVPLVAIRYNALRGSSFRYGGSDSI